MATVTLQLDRTKSRKHTAKHPSDLADGWVTFGARLEVRNGEPRSLDRLFQLYQSQRDPDHPSEDPHFRTLLWSACLATNEPILGFAEDCLSEAMGQKVNLPARLEQREPYVVLMAPQGKNPPADCSNTVCQAISSEDPQATPTVLYKCLSQPIENFHFIRVDINTDPDDNTSPVVGFTLTRHSDSKHGSKYETGLTLESPMPFSIPLMRWVLRHHAQKELRDPHRVEWNSILEALNFE